MANYSIKDLEKFTQIKAHTLRIWEQRYGLLSPKRTESNIRYYSDHDLKKILNVNLLYNNGLKISKIAELSDEAIFEKANSIILNSKGGTSIDEVNIIIELIMELDEKAITEILNRLSLEYGIEELYPKVIIPLLEKIGYLWQVNTLTVSHEHFISNIIREFFVVRIEGVKKKFKSKGKVVLFLPEPEKHELSLLFYYYVLKNRGYDCFYLGQSVPIKDFSRFISDVKPDYVVTSLIAELSKKHLALILDTLTALLPPERIFIGGIQVEKFKKEIPPKVNKIQHLKDIKL